MAGADFSAANSRFLGQRVSELSQPERGDPVE